MPPPSEREGSSGIDTVVVASRLKSWPKSLPHLDDQTGEIRSIGASTNVRASLGNGVGATLEQRSGVAWLRVEGSVPATLTGVNIVPASVDEMRLAVAEWHELLQDHVELAHGLDDASLRRIDHATDFIGEGFRQHLQALAPALDFQGAVPKFYADGQGGLESIHAPATDWVVRIYDKQREWAIKHPGSDLPELVRDRSRLEVQLNTRRVRSAGLRRLGDATIEKVEKVFRPWFQRLGMGLVVRSDADRQERLKAAATQLGGRAFARLTGVLQASALGLPEGMNKKTVYAARRDAATFGLSEADFSAGGTQASSWLDLENHVLRSGMESALQVSQLC